MSFYIAKLQKSFDIRKLFYKFAETNKEEITLANNNHNRRVVVTGIGIWSCLGNNINDVSASLRAGRSGIGIDEERLAYGYRCALTGVVERPALKLLLDRRQRAAMSEQAEYAYMASREALAMAKLDTPQPFDVACIFGNDASAKAIVEAHEVMKQTGDSSAMGANNVFQALNSTVTMNLSSLFGLRGTSFTLSGACASSSHAIGVSAMMIRQGIEKVVLCGGAQEINKYAMSSFDALGVFSSRTDCPQQASRPFERDRDGLVPSGGAAALVLEDYDHAVARGATILAEIAGYGTSTSVGGRLSAPDDSGIMLAMQRALDDAGLMPADIDYVNAHATSTPQGDAQEAEAIARLMGAHAPWVSSTKSMTGHECWMAGASEAVYSILMMRDGFIAPNINFENADEQSSRLKIVRQTVDKYIDTILSNSFGFGGTNSSLIIRRI